tara:strand:+ start:590 stop:1273 length:684 start_codon:yes stop_codon:yes gene_type:complete
MKKITCLFVGVALAAAASTSSANTLAGFEPKVSVGALAGLTGFGADVSWRFHENMAVTGRYTDGLSIGTDYDEDGVTYDADFDLKASSLKLDYFPFGGRFYLSAGVMMPNIEANVVGTPQAGGVYEFNNQSYSAAEIGSVVGNATLTDGTQPYVGIGWRSSHEAGFATFSELGVVATDASVSLSTTRNLEALDPALRADLQAEEESLRDDIDIPVFPVAVFGITYTF